MAYQKSEFDKSIALVNKFIPMASSVSTEHSDKVNAGTANYLQGYNYYKKERLQKRR